jgi:hypothetical protein
MIVVAVSDFSLDRYRYSWYYKVGLSDYRLLVLCIQNTLYTAGKTAKDFGMKKTYRYFGGIVGILLVFGLGLTGCPEGTPTFDGSTLAGTKWVVEMPGQQISPDSTKLIDLKQTLDFTSDTAGKFTGEITKFSGSWTEAEKTEANGRVAAENMTFTYTYDKTTKNGTISAMGGVAFTVDVSKKELTLGEGSTVFKLQ